MGFGGGMGHQEPPLQWGAGGTFDGDAHLVGVAGVQLTAAVHAQLEDPQRICGVGKGGQRGGSG